MCGYCLIEFILSLTGLMRSSFSGASKALGNISGQKVWCLKVLGKHFWSNTPKWYCLSGHRPLDQTFWKTLVDNIWRTESEPSITYMISWTALASTLTGRHAGNLGLEQGGAVGRWGASRSSRVYITAGAGMGPVHHPPPSTASSLQGCLTACTAPAQSLW